MDCLRRSVGNVFREIKSSNSPLRVRAELNITTPKNEVANELSQADLLTMWLQDNLNTLALNNSKVILLDSCLNRFAKLTSLDVSYNTIYTIDVKLNLLNLIKLNLSNNNLQSLDGLQSLTSLRSLNCSNNHLHSLESTVYMLIPLAASMTSLILTGNLVTNQPRYAEETLSILPLLEYLDGMRLDHGGDGGYAAIMSNQLEVGSSTKLMRSSSSSYYKKYYQPKVTQGFRPSLSSTEGTVIRPVPLLPAERAQAVRSRQSASFSDISNISALIAKETSFLADSTAPLNESHLSIQGDRGVRSGDKDAEYQANARIIRAVRNRDLTLQR